MSCLCFARLVDRYLMSVCYLQHRIATGSFNPNKGLCKGREGYHDSSNRPSCFNPKNCPFPIKYLSFDIKNGYLSENTIYTPQQYVLPTILYYLYL